MYERISRQKLANKTGSNDVNLVLIDGIPTAGFVVFQNVSSRANSFPLLELKVWGEDLSQNAIQFRDVKID